MASTATCGRTILCLNCRWIFMQLEPVWAAQGKTIPYSLADLRHWPTTKRAEEKRSEAFVRKCGSLSVVLHDNDIVRYEKIREEMGKKMEDGAAFIHVYDAVPDAVNLHLLRDKYTKIEDKAGNGKRFAHQLWQRTDLYEKNRLVPFQDTDRVGIANVQGYAQIMNNLAPDQRVQLEDKLAGQKFIKMMFAFMIRRMMDEHALGEDFDSEEWSVSLTWHELTMACPIHNTGRHNLFDGYKSAFENDLAMYDLRLPGMDFGLTFTILGEMATALKRDGDSALFNAICDNFGSIEGFKPPVRVQDDKPYCKSGRKHMSALAMGFLLGRIVYSSEALLAPLPAAVNTNSHIFNDHRVSKHVWAKRALRVTTSITATATSKALALATRALRSSVLLNKLESHQKLRSYGYAMWNAAGEGSLPSGLLDTETPPAGINNGFPQAGLGKLIRQDVAVACIAHVWKWMIPLYPGYPRELNSFTPPTLDDLHPSMRQMFVDFFARSFPTGQLPGLEKYTKNAELYHLADDTELDDADMDNNLDDQFLGGAESEEEEEEEVDGVAQAGSQLPAAGGAAGSPFAVSPLPSPTMPSPTMPSPIAAQAPRMSPEESLEHALAMLRQYAGVTAPQEDAAPMQSDAAQPMQDAGGFTYDLSDDSGDDDDDDDDDVDLLDLM